MFSLQEFTGFHNVGKNREKIDQIIGASKKELIIHTKEKEKITAFRVKTFLLRWCAMEGKRIRNEEEKE